MHNYALRITHYELRIKKGGVIVNSSVMKSSIGSMKSKEVINISDGARLGFVSDVEIDIESGRLVSITVPGAYRVFGLFGREEDIVIDWNDIKKIGEEIIIVDVRL